MLAHMVSYTHQINGLLDTISAKNRAMRRIADLIGEAERLGQITPAAAEIILNLIEFERKKKVVVD